MRQTPAHQFISTRAFLRKNILCPDVLPRHLVDHCKLDGVFGFSIHKSERWPDQWFMASAVLRNEIYIGARRDRRSRDCFDARVIAPSFVDPAMDLSAIGPRRHPHHPPKGCRKMRWILISTSGGNGRNRFVPALQEALRLFHAKEGQTLEGSLPVQLLVQSQQVEPTVRDVAERGARSAAHPSAPVPEGAPCFSSLAFD
jgi:hypothetical protein